MNTRIAAAAALAAAFVFPAKVHSQVDLRTTADEVLLDLVVRDSRGRVVRDLRADEIEVVDNGQARAVRSLRLIDGRVAVDAPERGAPPSTAAKPRPLHPLEESHLIVLAFESLDPDPARLARQAALDLLRQPGGSARFAVVTIDSRMRLLEDFTNDRQRLEAAVTLATSGSAMQIAAHSDQTRWRLENLVAAVPRDRPLEERVAEAIEYFKGMRTAVNSGVVPVYGQDAARAVNAELLLRALEFDEGTAREISGRAVVEAVLGLTRGFAAVPGRKTLLLFTDGLYVPYYLDAKFRAAMSAANRTGLSVYPINTTGLASTLENYQVRAEVAKAARISTQVSLSADNLFLVNRDQVFALERGEEGLRANPNLALSELADATGGTLVANTNDLRPHLRRILEDANTHYEVAYGPGIANYDGTFRTVNLRVQRPGVRVQSRSGYYALPPSVISQGLLPWEPPVLAALNATAPPRDLAFRVAAIRLEPLPEGTRTAIVIEAPLKQLRFTIDDAAKRFSAHASILALVRNEAGAVIRKLSFDLPLAGAADRVARLQGGRLIWHERVVLPPGAHSIVAALADRQGALRIGVQTARISIAPAQSGVAASQIALVRRIEETAADPDPENPFTVSGARVTPTVTPELPGGRDAQLALLLIVYPDAAAPERPRITVEYLRDGAVVDSEELEVPDAAGRSRLPYLLTSTGRRPGEWQVRATIRQGSRTIEETATVRIVDSVE